MVARRPLFVFNSIPDCWRELKQEEKQSAEEGQPAASSTESSTDSGAGVDVRRAGAAAVAAAAAGSASAPRTTAGATADETAAAGGGGSGGDGGGGSRNADVLHRLDLPMFSPTRAEAAAGAVRGPTRRQAGGGELQGDAAAARDNVAAMVERAMESVAEAEAAAAPPTAMAVEDSASGQWVGGRRWEGRGECSRGQGCMLWLPHFCCCFL